MLFEEEEGMDGETAEVWEELDLAIPDRVTGSASCQPVETPTLPGGRSATNAGHQKGRIQEMQMKEEATRSQVQKRK